MLGREKSFNIMEKTLSFSKANQVNMVLMGHNHFLTRYANSEIHQNTEEENAELFIQVIINKKIGVSSINSFSDEDLKQAIRKAEEAAKHQKEISDFIDLPKPGKVQEIKAYFPRTAHINPEEKALMIQDMISRAHGDRISLSGAFYTGVAELAIMNTNGIKEYFTETKSNLSVVASGKDTSGFASASNRDVDKINHQLLIEEALESTKTYDKTISIEPGEYSVILEEYAVAELLIYLSFIALSSESVEEKISFVETFKGQKIFPDTISLYDDSLHPETFRMPFDYEGIPKSRLNFIQQGVVTGNVTHNNYTAHKNNIPSTGHALPPSAGISSTEALHLHLDPGTDSKKDLISKMERGLYIKRFHYLTVVHPLKTLLSGMTRDGVFWVEKGKIKHRVENLRFTQSIIDILKNIKGMSKDRKTIWFRDFSVDFPTSAIVPKIYTEKFNFTGKTEF